MSTNMNTKEPSLKDLIHWLETKSEDEEYDYTSVDNCLFAQFYKSLGYDVRTVRPFTDIIMHDGSVVLYTKELDEDIALDDNYEHGEWTFGAALERANRYERLQAGPSLEGAHID